MVQHNYIQRLIWGRSAFEPPAPSIQHDVVEGRVEQPQHEPNRDEAAVYAQRYDERGHPINPESRAASRRLRRAQNDVLSTIGITLPTNIANNGTESSETQAAATRRQAREDNEDWAALWLSLGFEGLMSISTTAVHNQRIRFQTFSRYAGIPYSTALELESRRQSRASYFIAGEPEFWAGHVVDVVTKLLAISIPAGLDSLWIRCFGVERLAQQRTRSMHQLELGLGYAASAALVPFSAIITLQRLQLIPAQPFFIWPWQYSWKTAYVALLPPLPSAWSLVSAVQFCGSIPWSPLGLALLTEIAITQIRRILSRYIRAWLPRPDNPEPNAVAAASADDVWSLSEYPRFQGSPKEELAKDLRWIGKQSAKWWFTVKGFFAPAAVSRHRNEMLKTLLSPAQPAFHDEALQLSRELRELRERYEANEDRPLDDLDLQQLEDRLEVIETSLTQYVINTRSELGETSPVEEATRLTFEAREEMNALRQMSGLQDGQTRRNSRSGGPLGSHPTQSPAGSVVSSPSSSPVLEPTNVQVRTRSGSTSTLHMDVEINPAAANGSPYMTSFSASPRSAAVEQSISQVIADDKDTAPHYRVTQFTLLPADLAGQCIIRVAVQALILPLQSYQCRVIARRFLSVTNPGGLGEVYAPGSWFGLGLRGGSVLEYSHKIGLCLASELFLSMLSWRVIANTARYVGHWLE